MSSILHSNNSNEKKMEIKDAGTSRIKFKTISSGMHMYSSAESSRLTIPSKRNLHKKSSSRFTSRYSRDISELLDPTNCYHPQCSFAYSLTGNMRKPSLITECLPQSIYQKLAMIWNIDPLKAPRLFGNTCKIENQEEEDAMVEEFIRSVERDMGIRSDISEDLQVNIESESRSYTETERKGIKDNPYQKFLKKNENLDLKQKRKTNLGKRAGKITKSIIKKFLEWYQSLGGNDGETFIEESTLLELFQIGFDMPAAKALSIQIKEMPTVPECLAILRNEPKFSTRYGLKQFLKEDIKMENIPMKMFAFGSMLPKEKPPLRYKPPKNFTKKTWLECSRVPSELNSMMTVWVGLEKLRSTIAFSTWLKNHPEITPPDYLTQKGLLQINYEDWNQMYKGFELEMDNADLMENDMKSFEETDSIEESQLSESSSLKYDSFDSLL